MKEKNKYLVGLTGGIGTGKSTVLQMFAKKGAGTVDADEIVHGLYAGDKTLRNAISREFGETVISADGMVDRKALGEIVFNSERERTRLEQIVHPRVRRKIKAEVIQTQMPVIFVDIPLLYESGWSDFFDLIIVVNAKEENRLLRLVKRGMKRIEARKRIDAQMPMWRKIKQANFVINNDGTRLETQKQVDHLWKRISVNNGG